ncbi:alpha-D-ribose 1-methylphosphonate 5-triphosphate diphosphatase [Pseudanabaena sp. PCC 6802]|uniref:alpha-D-ribose 1-methylphosphonate 5-triphosphate diphosphatase n=1 Tax=Pseudanabaena sp. PCC 6802 TaxID=118173 RepID=UPI0003495151|nr:alpha-D-ribose 1-methylphosphonate 5-triphosphate diphosphatase [Pseudanabaena sp. PCC 6802]
MNEQIYTNYRLLLPDREILGTLVVRDGTIADIQPDVVAIGQNGGGDYLMPGLVELHTDNLETCISPRPGIRWPLEAAAIYHDRELAAAGITTVCDAIAIGDVTPTSLRFNQYDEAIDAIQKRQQAGGFSVDHRLHLRCELGFDRVYDITERYASSPLLVLISLMDHTPGQRQFVNLDKFKAYYSGKHGIKPGEMERFIQDRLDDQQRHAESSRRALVALTQARGIPLASHDDETVEHVRIALEEGAAIAEFPTTFIAAKEAHTNGLQVMVGAPNLVLGGSHSGNVSAMDLVESDLADIVSSDYVPLSLLQSAFTIAHKTGKPLYETIHLITSNPAKAIRLDGDRGSLEIGKRADLAIVRDDGVVPKIKVTICQGYRVA